MGVYVESRCFPLRKVGPEGHGPTQMAALPSAVDLWEHSAIPQRLCLSAAGSLGSFPLLWLPRAPPNFILPPWPLSAENSV